MRSLRVLTCCAGAVLLAACASTPEAPPEPGEARGGLPALSGQRVMVLPIQRNAWTAREAADAELGFALQQRLPGITWVVPSELARLRGQTPVMDFPLDRLPIDMFFSRQVERVGDPIYGVLRRTAAVADSDYALIPLRLGAQRPVPDEPETGLSLMSTLIDIRTGRVLWFASVGADGDLDAPQTLATLMDELARSLLPTGGGAPR